MRLVVASQNRDKLKEFQTILTQFGVRCLLPSAVLNTPIEFPEETGSTFIQNAQLKAISVFKQTGCPTIADDSGLLVKALGGFPGVNSARWQSGTDRQRSEALLEKLTNSDDRRAQFSCVLCFVSNTQAKPLFFTGSLSGTIAREVKGSAGFGYDPIFIPTGESKTLAELGEWYKSQYSHRAKALKKLGLFFSKNMIN